MSRRVVFVFLIVWSLAAAVTPFQGDQACAAEQNHAAERIRFSISDERTYCVEFAEQEISGIKALRLTGLRVVTKTDPQFGEFVCKIEDVGPEASECPASDGSFWSYFRLDSNGAWRFASTGASATKVRCGDGEGWAWFPRGVGPPPSAPASFASMCPGRTCGGQPAPTPPAGSSPSPESSGSATRPRANSGSAAKKDSPDRPSQSETLQSRFSEPTESPSKRSSPPPRLSSTEEDKRSIGKWVVVGAPIVALSLLAAYLKYRRKMRSNGD